MPKLSKEAALIEENRGFHNPGLNNQNPFLRGAPVQKQGSALEDNLLSPEAAAIVEANRQRHEKNLKQTRRDQESAARLLDPSQAPDPHLMADPRGKLAQAHEGMKVATAALEKAKAAEHRATALLAEREEHFAALQRSAEREHAKRVAADQAWAKGSNTKPARDDDDARSTDAVRAAKQAVESSKQVVAALQQEREAADAGMVYADAVIKGAAQACLYAEAIRIGEEMAQRREELCGLADTLRAMGSIWIPIQHDPTAGRGVAPIRMPPIAMRELEFVQSLLEYPRYRRDQQPMLTKAHWQVFYDALLKDPDAELPEPT